MGKKTSENDGNMGNNAPIHRVNVRYFVKSFVSGLFVGDYGV